MYLDLENENTPAVFNNNNNKMAEEPLIHVPNGILRTHKGRTGKLHDFTYKVKARLIRSG